MSNTSSNKNIKVNIIHTVHKNQKGQVFVVVFVLLILALSIGMSVSSKYITSFRSFQRSDEGNRALSIAEALIEHLLLLPLTTLESYALNNNCGTACQMQITSGDGQIITADATLTVLGSSSQPYNIDLKTTESSQVSLLSYPAGRNLYVCWTNSNMSVSGIYVYGTLGDYTADSYAYNAVGTTHSDNNFSDATAMFGYPSCFSFVTQANSALLRLKAVYAEDALVVIPDSGTELPSQGVVINSQGSSGSSKKSVTVIITDPNVPSQFDYVLYQKSATEPLSN